MSNGQTIDQMGQAKKQIRDVIEVKRHGNAIVIPDGLSLERVDQVIHARLDYENQIFTPIAEIDAPFVYEAAYALNAVLTEKFGWANGIPTPGFFGPKPPQMLAVPIGPGKTVQVPWGRFALPNIGPEGWIQSGTTQKDDGRVVFQLVANVKRVYEPVINELIEDVKKYIRDHSIYRNRAFRVKLFDNYGNRLPMPEPEFIELDPNVNKELVLPEATAISVETNIFTPIRQTERVVKHGIPLKRGVLLAGQFGTGKTMIAAATANLALHHGWTYVECVSIEELPEVVRLARQYGDRNHGVVLFCEDIDRLMRGDERTVEIDNVLNVIDGVESKGTALMIVLTTNELEKITSAMLRPGRLDAIIHIPAPDAQAAIRLARQYGRGLIDPNDPLTESGKILDGKIPAIIRESVERSKLRAISITPDDGNLVVTDEALAYAAAEMDEHVRLLMPKPEDKRSETVKAADALASAVDRATEAGVAAALVPFPITPSAYTDHPTVPGKAVFDHQALADHGTDGTTGVADEKKRKRPASQSQTDTTTPPVQ